ncbi:hypothetical protein HK098_002981, partial [Nowakowskiella sp. JEL0407]
MSEKTPLLPTPTPIPSANTPHIPVVHPSESSLTPSPYFAAASAPPLPTHPFSNDLQQRTSSSIPPNNSMANSYVPPPPYAFQDEGYKPPVIVAAARSSYVLQPGSIRMLNTNSPVSYTVSEGILYVTSNAPVQMYCPFCQHEVITKLEHVPGLIAIT